MDRGMLLDLAFLILLVGLAALGAWRGAIPSGSGLLAMIAGYAGAIVAASLGAGWVAETLVVSPWIAPAIAGTIGFAVAYLVASAAGDVAVAWDRARVELGGRGAVDRGFGGLFGLARGALLVVLLAIGTSWLDAARDLGVVEGLSGVPETDGSSVARASGDLVEAAVSTALADAGPAAEVAARITARPGRTLGSMQGLLEDERFSGLFEDAMVWTLIQNGSIDYAMNRASVRSIVNDPEMRGRFADLGLVGEAAREDPAAFREAMSGVLAEVGPRVARLHQDEELKALATDPEIVELVQAGDTLALMGHPRIQRIVARLSSDL